MKHDANDDDLSNAKDTLLQFGVPLHVAEYALDSNPSKRLYKNSIWLYLSVMILGFIVGGYYLYNFNITSEVWILEQNLLQDAFLIDYEVGFSGVLGIFAWILVASLLVSAFQGKSRRTLASHFVFMFLDEKNQKYVRGLPKKILKKMGGNPDPLEFMKLATVFWASCFYGQQLY